MSALFSSRIALVILLGFISGSLASAKILDNEVDPENLGKGDWIYFLNAATDKLGGNVETVTDVPSLMNFYKSVGIKWIAIKAGTGGDDFPSAQNPQVTKELIDAAHAAGLKIFPYTRSDGKDVPGEIALAIKFNEMGADGFIIDAEFEWEASRLADGPARAIQLCEGIKQKFPNRFLGHAPFPIISKHASFPYKEFGYYCDAVMPQDYWKQIGISPRRMVRWMNEEWHQWQKSLSDKWTNAIKPLAPIGQGWNPSNDKIVTKEEIMEFVAALNHDKNPVTRGGYKGVSYWRADMHTHKMWKAIQKANIGDPSSTPESILQQPEPEPTFATGKSKLGNANSFIMDDDATNVTFNGSWNAGAGPGTRFGSTYFCANTVGGDATSTVIYRPSFQTRGTYNVFVWYTAHPNRSEKAPWVISHESGVTTNFVNQTINGGTWVQIGTNISFAPEGDNFVTLGNNTGESPDHYVIADAVRFVRVDNETASLAATAPNNEPQDSQSTTEPAPAPVRIENPNEIILDDNQEGVAFTGSWYPGKKKNGRYGDSHMCANTTAANATATAIYRPNISSAGIYDVYIWYSDAPNRSAQVPWVVIHEGGVFTNKVDQRVSGGDWYLIAANLHFPSGTNSFITVSNDTGEGPNHVLIADAVRLVRKDVAKKEGSQ